MTISKIEYKKIIWSGQTSSETTVIQDRKDYKGNFENYILSNISESDIQNYAEDNLDMIKEDDIEETNLSNFRDQNLIAELKDRGYEIIKCATISDSLRLQKVKELMEL